MFNLKVVACLNAFTFSAFQILLLTLYPYLADHLGVEIGTILLSFSLGSALFLVGSPFWATRSDHWGRKKVLVIGLIGLLVSFALLLAGTALGLPGLIVSRIIYGLVACSVVPVAQALQNDLSKGQHTRAMSLHSLSMNLGRAFALTLVVFAAHHIHFIAQLGVFWLVALIAINLLSDEQKMSAPVQNAKFEFKRLKWIFMVALVFTCFLETIQSSLAIHLKTVFTLDSLSSGQVTAKLLLGCSIGIVMVQALVHRLGHLIPHFHWRARLGTGFIALFMGAFLMFSSISMIEVWIAVGFLAIAIGIIPPAYLALASESDAGTHQGKRAGLIGSAHTLGYALGGLIAAVVRKGIFSW